jgi:hypothetical protein
MGFGKFAYDYSPQIVFMFNSGDSVSGTIARGIFVQRDPTSVSIVPDPGNESNVSRPIVGVITAALAGTNSATVNLGLGNVLGVAAAAIPPSTWGPVCVGGPCKVAVTASSSFANLSALKLIGTLGRAITVSSPMSFINAICVVSATVTAGGLLDCFIESIPAHPVGYGQQVSI